MMPKKLVAKRSGWRTLYSRAQYSNVNSKVKNHSSASSSLPWRSAIGRTLSSTTTVTLNRMAAINAKSNAHPARVSDSKMTVYNHSRKPKTKKPKKTNEKTKHKTEKDRHSAERV